MNSSWNKDWLEAQRQYVEALISFATPMTQKQKADTETPDWQKALDSWWRNCRSAVPEDSQAVFSNLMQHSHSWYGITEQFDELLRTIAGADEKTADWQTVLADQFAKMKSQLQNGFAGAENHAWPGGMQSPMHSWQNMFNSMSSTFSAAPADLQANFEKYFSLPGLGRNQQSQEQIQAGLGLWQDYQTNCQEYRETLNNIAVNSLARLHKKILVLGEQEKSISSIRDLYDLWVDSHGEAYSAYVLTEGYSKLYGRLVNSMLAFRAHGQKFISETSQALNLPNKEQQDTLLNQQQALQQELRDIKKQMEEDKLRIKLLEDEIKKQNIEPAARTSSSKPGKKKK